MSRTPMEGKDFIAVPMRDRTLIIPLSKNPLKRLQEEGKKISKHLTVAQIKQMALEEAEKEAPEHLIR